MAELNEGSTHYYSAFMLNGERFTIGAFGQEKFNSVERVWGPVSPDVHTEPKRPGLMAMPHLRRRYSCRPIRR